MNSVCGINRIVHGVGVVGSEHSAESKLKYNFNISEVILISRRLTYIPKIVRHALTFIELASKTLIEAVKFKPDIIHCHDTLVLPIGLLVKMFTRSKLIYDAHELESDKNGITPTLSKLTLLVEKTIWPFIDHLIVVSPAIEEWYVKHLGEKESSVILNSPIVNRDSVVNSDYLKQKFSIDRSNIVFLYIGILGKGRGIEKVSNVFKCNSIKSSIVFLGYGPLVEELELLSTEYSNIFYHDPVPHEQVVSIAESADYGLCFVENVSLSDYYCLPNKLFEYCLSGTPVISSDFPELKRVISKFNLGFYCEPTTEHIKDTVKRIEENNETISLDIDSLFALTWEAQECKIKNIYNNLLDEGNE